MISRIIRVSLFALLLLCTLCGCKVVPTEDADGVKLTDALGNVCHINNQARVVSCYASFAECWLLAGGELAGVTQDAVDEHGLDVGDAEIIGTVKHIDMERLIRLEPDYVILSADLAAHLALKDSLDAMGIAYGYFRVDVFEDYKKIMDLFCQVSGREDLYKLNVLDVDEKINGIRSKIPHTDASVLLMRVYSSGMKAKAEDNIAGVILKELGLKNIADDNRSLLEDLSLEHIVKSDPDYIFAMTMGNEAGAMEYFNANAQNNPMWSELCAVKNGNYHMLPKELFHYKPNNRWSESYEYIAKLVWQDLFQ